MADDKPPRNVSIIRRSCPAIVRVDGRGRKVYYLVRECDPDTGPPVARVFAVARLGANHAYRVRCAPATNCDCLGFLSRGKCVHTGMLIALERADRI